MDRVLDELGCDRNRELLVLNKIDRINDPTVFAVLQSRFPKALFLSAATGKGADSLTEAVLERARGIPVRVQLEANYRNGKLMHYLARHAHVENESYNDSVACIQAVIPTQKLDLLRSFGKDVVILHQTAT